jgi:hypothetical protein
MFLDESGVKILESGANFTYVIKKYRDQPENFGHGHGKIKLLVPVSIPIKVKILIPGARPLCRFLIMMHPFK